MILEINLQRPGQNKNLRRYNSLKVKNSIFIIPRIGEYIELDDVTYEVTIIFHCLDENKIIMRVK